MTVRNVKRTIALRLEETDDGWTAIYESSNMAGSATGSTAGDAVDKLLDGLEKVQEKTEELFQKIQSDSLPPHIKEFLIKHGIGEGDTDDDDDGEGGSSGPLLN